MFVGRFKTFPNFPAWYLQISYGVWRFHANLEANLRPSQYSEEYETRPSALHSIIRILPTTYWTWSDADENHIMVLSPHGKLPRTKKQLNFYLGYMKGAPRHFKN